MSLIKITPRESMFLQCLAMTSLLAELSNSEFLKSNYFKKELSFENEIHKQILIESGIGNPATMQMMLYSLLVIPKEILSREEYEKLENYAEKVNTQVCELIEDQETSSSYDEEDQKENINYFNHIRNAISHSRCKYESINGKNYVTFTDKNRSGSECNIKIECVKVGLILMKLQDLLMQYFKDNYK